MLNDDVDVRMSDGRLFHTRGPSTANARSPTVERLRWTTTSIISINSVTFACCKLFVTRLALKILSVLLFLSSSLTSC